MHGKKPENPDFKCWNITPTGAFNYAYADDGQPIEFQGAHLLVLSKPTCYFDIDSTIAKLRIPVKQIEWDLVDNRYTPAQPEQGCLTFQNNETKYIDLVPYGCTELRLTVFPDADAEPLPVPDQPDYTRPADAPDCVSIVDDAYFVYFEEPRFCWDEPIYCKVRMADDTTIDLHSNQGGEMCEIVGKTANGRYIWRWIGHSTTEQPPVELIFTNHDLLTDIMPFVNGGYYNYDRLLYDATNTGSAGITTVTGDSRSDDWYTLDGRRLKQCPTIKGFYLKKNSKVLVN